MSAGDPSGRTAVGGGFTSKSSGRLRFFPFETLSGAEDSLKTSGRADWLSIATDRSTEAGRDCFCKGNVAEVGLKTGGVG